MYFERKVTLGEIIMAISLLGGAALWWGSQSERLAQMDSAITETREQLRQEAQIASSLQDTTEKILQILDWNHLAIPNAAERPH